MNRHWNRKDMALDAISIWGADWQSPMARAVSVNPRTVRRWAAGDSPVPLWVRDALASLKRTGI